MTNIPMKLALLICITPSLALGESISYNGASYLSESALVKDMAEDFGNALDEAMVARDSDNSLEELVKTAPKIPWGTAKSWHLSKFGNCAKMAPPMCMAREVHQQRECKRRQGRLDTSFAYTGKLGGINDGETILYGGNQGPCAGMTELVCKEQKWYCNKLYLGLKKDGSTTWKIVSRGDEIDNDGRTSGREFPEVTMSLEFTPLQNGTLDAEYRVGIVASHLRIATQFGVSLSVKNDKIVVVDVITGSPASSAGLAPGDAIVSFDGERVENLPNPEGVVIPGGRTGQALAAVARRFDRTTTAQNFQVRKPKTKSLITVELSSH